MSAVMSGSKPTGVQPLSSSCSTSGLESGSIEERDLERFNQVARLASDWFWEMDHLLRFTYQSPEFEKITGIPIDKVIGLTREEAFAGLIDNDEKWQCLGARLRSREDYSMVWSLNHHDGRTRYLRTRGNPMFDKDQQFCGYRGVGSDVTESVEAIIQLSEYKVRFKDFSQVAADWFFELDEKLTLSYLSDDIHQLSGQSSRELINRQDDRPFRDGFESPDEYQRIIGVLQLHQAFDYEYRWRKPDGTFMYVHTNGVPIFEGDRFCGYRCASTDITERKLEEQLALDRESRFRTIIENVTDIIYIINANGEINFVNSACQTILGYSEDEMKALSSSTLVFRANEHEVKKANREALENPGQVVHLTIHTEHKDGSARILETSRQKIIGLEHNESAQIVVHLRDVTGWYLTSEALKDSEQRLRDFAEIGADWFWEQDENLRFTYISSNYPRFSKDDREGVMGKTREEITKDLDTGNSKWRELAEICRRRQEFTDFEYQINLPSGEPLVVRINGKPLFDAYGHFLGYRGVGVDVTNAYKLAQQLKYQATHDELTGLVNRREFEKRMTRVITSSQGSDAEHALCYIDLDQFKIVNDTCGHEAGDDLLRQITGLLQQITRKRDTLARLGGDEFGILLEGCTIEQAHRSAESIRQSIDQFRFGWQGRSFRIGSSMGLIPVNGDSGAFSDLLRDADAACYTAKDAGRNRIHVSLPGNDAIERRHREMQSIVDINHAIDDERFVLYFQLIQPLNKDIKEGKSYEALVRMKDENSNMVLPGAFLPAAERYNRIYQLDELVFSKSLAWLSTVDETINCSVNISGMTLASEDFLDFILKKFSQSSVSPNRVCFEITETAAIANLTQAINFIEKLKHIGCQFSLDDFGSGLSSFGYLKTLPVDNVKIDGMFVREMLKDNINHELIKSINDICHVMGKKTIAECVENQQLLNALVELGVDYGQGNGIAEPLPAEKL